MVREIGRKRRHIFSSDDGHKIAVGRLEIRTGGVVRGSGCEVEREGRGEVGRCGWIEGAKIVEGQRGREDD